MNKYYFTFGVSMAYRKRFVEILAEDASKARQMMFAGHGSQWSMMYEADQFVGLDTLYEYEKLATFRQDDPAIDWEL